MDHLNSRLWALRLNVGAGKPLDFLTDIINRGVGWKSELRPLSESGLSVDNNHRDFGHGGTGEE